MPINDLFQTFLSKVGFDTNNNQNVTLGTELAGEDLVNNVLKVEQRYSYGRVTATGATTIKSGSGYINSISINNPSALTGATTATTITIYDNTAASGTISHIFSLPTSANLATALPFSIPIHDSYATGITVNITLGTSGSWTPDITVNYR